MQGYRVESRREEVFNAFEFRVAPGKTETVEGRLLEVSYLRDSGLPAQTGLAVVRNHQAALKSMGGEVVAVIGSASNPAYLTFKVRRGDEVTWGEIDVTAGGNDFRITTVTVSAMEQEVTGKTIADGLARDGHMAIYGILFDTAKATLRPESDPALEAIRDLLKASPSLSIYVVGHTDDVGTLASNMALSKERAETVVTALISRYTIAASRLTAEGVGPLAPVAPNTTEPDRQRNRRVEIVVK